eukprot:5953463-Prymnesium_polylepis.2
MRARVHAASSTKAVPARSKKVSSRRYRARPLRTAEGTPASSASSTFRSSTGHRCSGASSDSPRWFAPFIAH